MRGSTLELGRPKLLMRNPYPGTHLDGMTIDNTGMLWIAVCGGGRIIKISPGDGEILGEILLPVKLPTNCVFGGPELTEMYVTTARETLSADELQQYPLSGSVLRVTNLQARGVAAVPAKLSTSNSSKG
jgi:sugar lactone lactonase YvrE